ncbi:MAG: family 43 glycosylhydrolase, partial [Bacteroidota bacterium]
PQLTRGREVADPSIFKHKNKYYALSTQMYSFDGPGMLVWESEDMVNWSQPKNIVINGKLDPMMAPELIYSEGSYYLYWSVPGTTVPESHYLAKYTPDKESGDFDPFGANAEYNLLTNDFLNIGEVNIDGEIFFDKNDIYMFFCGFGGIQYKKLLSLENSGSDPKIQLSDCVIKITDTEVGDPGAPGWTEAPGLFYEDGYYYMTYSGNHFQSPTYQIHSARGSSIENIKPYKQNPLIEKRDGLYNGLGNNNFITGPDLKTKYTSYHVKIGTGIHTSESGPINRQMMLDKYTVSPESGIETEAPVFTDQEVPSAVEWENKMADLGDNMETSATVQSTNGITTLTSGELLSVVNSKVDFVVEGNIRPVTAESDISRYGLTSIDGKLKFAIELGDSATGSGAKLVYYIDGEGWTDLGITGVVFNVWHKLNIDKKENKIKFYYDDRYVGEAVISINEEGKFGYFSEGGAAELSWIGQANY